MKIDAPILSIDYSFAPEAPFPRAFEEVFYAYCWALKNSQSVGSSGENIIFVGDSAGANLLTAVCIQCIEMGIPKPKGLMNIYGYFSTGFTVSPSRFMSLTDLCIPYLMAIRCYVSYLEKNEPKTDMKPLKFKPENRYKSLEQEFDVKLEDSYLVSTYYAPAEILAQFPPTIMVAGTFDSLLDETVEFAKKLKKLNVDTTLDLFKGLTHGFLHFAQVRKLDPGEKIKAEVFVS